MQIEFTRDDSVQSEVDLQVGQDVVHQLEVEIVVEVEPIQDVEDADEVVVGRTVVHLIVDLDPIAIAEIDIVEGEHQKARSVAHDVAAGIHELVAVFPIVAEDQIAQPLVLDGVEDVFCAFVGKSEQLVASVLCKLRVFGCHGSLRQSAVIVLATSLYISRASSMSGVFSYSQE